MARCKRCIVIFTEGETEAEFYDSILDSIKSFYNVKNFNADKIIKKCIGGISRFDRKLLNKFKTEVISKYSNCEIIVFLCYDTDVFECSVNPPVNWDHINDCLIKLGANKVIHIKAEKCIEDIFLIDIPGICDYLHINRVTRLSGNNGVDKMQQLYNRGNKVYQKGYSCSDLVKSLDINKIFSKKEKMFSPFIDELIK